MEKNKRKQIKIIFDKFTFFVLGSMFISALLNVGYKYILKYYSPFSLYVIRAISVGILLLLIFRPKIKLVTKKQVSLFTFSALLYSAAAIFQYISISRIGISITILLLSLSPSIVYILSMLLLKEKLSKNKIISSVIIISCAVAAVVLL
ncbi:hypothetical protein COV16_03355 [Candidatus Woesearchaeota archaeon CG10_big_fil_rev_8_21_14_0_10_34_8]|nr:MAG: hypothetical protein COV16_03355 [Candidatus Woesearchaeota archaeon CG10_big_fil_rev_8_21_14_0_10_34_8]